MELECKKCGKVFDSQKALNAHSQVHGGRKVTLKCEECGKEFEVVKSKEDSARFCSIDCKNEWQKRAFSGEGHPNYKKIEMKCENCGKKFKIRPSRQERARFCSQECMLNWRSNKFSGKGNPLWNRVTLECEECGKEFEVVKSRENTARFCSKKCLYAWNKGRSQKQNPPILEGKDHPRYNSKKVKCDQCGKKVEKRKSIIKRSKHHFCSIDCHGKWKEEHPPDHIPPALRGKNSPSWKGGYEPYYGPNWREQRRKILERDNHTCQRCGKTKEEIGKEPDIHHVKPFREFKNGDESVDFESANKLTNLVCLCPACHHKIEKHASELGM